jgi:GTP-binding protein HflX
MTEQIETEEKKEKVLLIGIYGLTGPKELAEEHLDELEDLTETFGVEVTDRILSNIRKFDSAKLFGSGKIEEIKERLILDKATMVIIDHNISPAQQRNLEKLLGVSVLDRTEVIIGVFAQRAQSKEAKLQVELASTRYEAPRLKRLWTHLSRQKASGGGKFLKGDGETQLEIDKRLLQKRVDRLLKELEEVKAHRDMQRQARMRSATPIFGIVGYTNAGKSTLLNALTDAGVFVEDKLFATLDTTTRKFTLSNNQEVLLIDTVGFIRKLPHHLIAAFKSTLEESMYADVLLHVVDSSHPLAEEQVDTTLGLLKELNGGDIPVITVFNKTDKEGCEQNLQKLRFKCPKNVMISATNQTGFEELEDRMFEEIKNRSRTLSLRVPQSDYAVVTELTRLGNILEQEYEDNDILMQVNLPSIHVHKFKEYEIEASV